MLSLSAFPYYTPFCRAQHGFQCVRFPLESDPHHHKSWFAAPEDSLTPTNVPPPESEQCNSGADLSAKLGDGVATKRSEPRAVNDSPKFSCKGYPTPMNGANDTVMTGSSNPRAEQLSWLAEVATANVRTTQNSSPSHHNKDAAGPPLLHNSECHSQRSSLNSILLGVNPSNQRIYAPYHAERFHAGHQTSGASGNRLSLYYSQAPRTAPYSGFYHTEHRLPYSQVVADGLLCPGRVPHPYYQNELYSPTITSIANVHGPLPHSPSYLHPAASMSPVGLSNSPSSQQPTTILVSRTVDDHEKGTLSMQGACNSPQYHREDRRKSYKSPEPKNQSPPSPYATKDLPLRQNTSPPHLTYKVPTGKEGSLKHRILRPPSINIVDPPPTVLDAPLSAPPIRSHREPSPKQLKPDNYCSYQSFSPQRSFVLDGSHVLAQHQISAPSFVVPASTAAPTTSHSIPPTSSDSGSQLKYPHAFMKGSIVQLANSQLKPVELMTTEDFMECEALSSNLKIDSSSVICIEKMPASGSAKLGFSVGRNKLQISVEAPLEHPFFVYKQGWSSCSPERSHLRYGLSCSKLKVGDTCIFLTVKDDKQASSKSPNLVPTNLTMQAPATETLCLGTVKAEALHLPTDGQRSYAADNSTAPPNKRKRRWSAPCQVTCDKPSNL